jgi:hypothetical protein
MFNGEELGGPDLAVWVLGIVTIDALVRVILGALQGSRAPTHLALLLTAASAAITVKRSAARLGIAASALCVVVSTRLAPRWLSDQRGLAPTLRVLAPSIVLLATWVLRGYVLSGYPLFPSTLGGVMVERQVPAEAARAEARWIMSWARSPGLAPDVVLADWRWIGDWAKGIRGAGSLDILIPLGIAGLLLATAVARRRSWGREPAWLAVAALPPAIALAIWFLIAPAPRFAGARAWLKAACGLLLAAERWGVRTSLNTGIVVLSVALGLGAALQSGESLRIPPGPSWGFYPLPQPTLVEEELTSGLTVLRPAEGDQCWVSPLLCTPGPLPGLRLRVPGDRSSGFRIGSAED